MSSDQDAVVERVLEEASKLNYYWPWEASQAKLLADKILGGQAAGTYIVRRKSKAKWEKSERKVSALVLSVKGEMQVWHFDISISLEQEEQYQYRLTLDKHTGSLDSLITEYLKMRLRGANMKEQVTIRNSLTYDPNAKFKIDPDSPPIQSAYIDLLFCCCGLTVEQTMLPDGYSLHKSLLQESLDMPYYRDPNGVTMWRLPAEVYSKCTQGVRNRIKGMAHKPNTTKG